MSLRRQSRSSSHTSQTDFKLEASCNERSTRSRTSSEDLVVLELPRYVRTKRTSHPNMVAESVKNGKGGAVVTSPDGETHKRGLRSADHVSNDKDLGTAIDHLGGGDANVSGRTRRRSGRITSNQEDSEKPPTLQQNSPTEGRSLRRRTRSGTATDSIGNGPSHRPKDNEANNLPPESQDSESSPKPATTIDSSMLDMRKGNAAVSLSNKHSNKKQVIPESTSVHKEPIPLKSLQVGSKEEEAQTETPLTTDQSERPQKAREKVSRLEPAPTSSERILSRTSPRRTRQASGQPTEPKETLWNDKGKLSEPASSDSNFQPSNNVQEGKTTPRKRTRSSSTSVSPKKHSDSQEEPAAVPGSPKKRKTVSICRDLSQDFNATKPSTAETTITPAAQSACNNEITAESQDSHQSFEKAQGATVPEDVERGTLENVPQEPATTVVEAVQPRSRRRSGTSPIGTPQNQSQLDLTKSPTRRGLRSSGSILETPLEVAPKPDMTPNKKPRSNSIEVSVTPSVSPAATPKKSSSKKKLHKKDAAHEKCASKEGKEDLGAGKQDTVQINKEDVDYEADEWYEDIDDGEPFYFESDHMAIKGNKDYRMLLRTLTTLEAQRKQAIQDLDQLLECRDKALKNPIKFVHKLQHKDTLKLPHYQRVVTCPDVDWGRYMGPPETNELLGLVSQPRSMRPSKSTSAGTHAQVGCGSCSTSQNKLPLTDPQATSAAGAPLSQDPNVPSTSSTPDPVQNSNMADYKHDCKDIKRKIAEGNKPATFNQLWTREEQRRLEEFLIKFPTEEVEARRWEKIAKALGNRSAQQVASRVQKYFIKLMKAGLPVPGRLPNLSAYQNYKKSSKRMHPFTKPLYQPSTFLQSIQPPVYMTEDDPYTILQDELDDDDDDEELISDDETIPEELRNTPEYQEMMRLKILKKRKVRQQGHAGFRCDGCNMEPIVGIRWHCTECPEPVSTDLCQACVNHNFNSKHHSSSHRMEPVHASFNQSYVDGDYTSFEPISGDYNYLDPNYNPVQAT